MRYLKSFSFESKLPTNIIFENSNFDHIWEWLIEEADEKINKIIDLSYGKAKKSKIQRSNRVLNKRKTRDIDSNTNMLNENIKQLKTQYNSLGLQFILENSLIKISENIEYLLNNLPEIKDFLVKRLNAKFNSINKWHIRKNGIRYLRSRKIKFNPSRTKEILKSKLYKFINQIKEEELKESLKKFLDIQPEFL